MKTESKVADVNAWVLMIDSVRSDVPPPMMRVGLKVFVTCGGDVLIGSVSADKQPAAVQPAATLVFTTPLGAEITAVLVTRVCAWALVAVKMKEKRKAQISARENAPRRKTSQQLINGAERTKPTSKIIPKTVALIVSYVVLVRNYHKYSFERRKMLQANMKLLTPSLPRAKSHVNSQKS